MNALFICSSVTFSVNSSDKSIREPSGTGTLRAPPLNLPSNSGNTLPIAVAAPVEVGIIFIAQALPLLSLIPFLCVTSNVTWSFV